MVGIDFIDQAHLFSLSGGHPTAGISHLTNIALGNQFHQARECADVGRHADIGFLDSQKRILGGVANVAGHREIDATTDCTTLDADQNRNPGVLQAVK